MVLWTSHAEKGTASGPTRSATFMGISINLYMLCYAMRKMCVVVQHHLGKGAFPAPVASPGEALSVAAGCSRFRKRQGLEWRSRLLPSHLSSCGSWFRGGPSTTPWQRPAVASPLRGASKLPQDPHWPGGDRRPLGPPRHVHGGQPSADWMRASVSPLDHDQGHVIAPWTLDQSCAPWTV